MLQARESTGEYDPIRVILVEDDAGDAALIKRTLRQGFGHYRVSHCERLAVASRQRRPRNTPQNESGSPRCSNRSPDGPGRRQDRVGRST